MASPFFPMTTTRPSLTPPSIGGGFSTSPPTGSLLPAGFAAAGQQPLSASGTNTGLFGGLMRPSEAEQQHHQLMPMASLPAGGVAAAQAPATTTTTTGTPTPTAAPTTASGGSTDDTQVMSKLQQLMNQMGTFMKSVDARLTTLEKMTGQLMTNQAEQAKSMELRFQEIAQLVQQKSSIIQLQPPTSQQPQQPVGPAPTTTTYGGYPAAMQQQQQQQPSSADYELARQLQEEFDQEAYRQQQQQKQQPVAAQRPGQPLYAPMGGPPMPGMGIPMQPNLTALQMQQMQPRPPAGGEARPDPRQLTMCPICSVSKPLGEMEEHVNQHFDESEGVVADALDRSKAKEPRGFWDRLFGADEEPSPSLQVAAQTGPAYPTQPMMYPTTGAAPGQYAGWPPAAYPQTYSYRR